MIIGLISTAFEPQDILEPGQTLLDNCPPAQRLNRSDLTVYSDPLSVSVSLEQLNRSIDWFTFSDTNSMLPLVDSGNYAVGFTPQDPSEINTCDVILFQRPNGLLVFHRVVDRGTDKDGAFFITQGDNLDRLDKHRVRFSDVRSVMLLVTY